VKTTKEAVLKRPARAATFAANNTRCGLSLSLSLSP
jgi:hypothetical protein